MLQLPLVVEPDSQRQVLAYMDQVGCWPCSGNNGMVSRRYPRSKLSSKLSSSSSSSSSNLPPLLPLLLLLPAAAQAVEPLETLQLHRPQLQRLHLQHLLLLQQPQQQLHLRTITLSMAYQYSRT